MKLHLHVLSSLLCALSTNVALASAPFEVKLDDQENRNYGEFGRSVKPRRRVAKHEPTEADIMYRELIEEVQLMQFASMSMSMDTSLGDNGNTPPATPMPSPAPVPPTGTPTSPQTSSPTEATITASSCASQPQVLINIALEVETVDADTEIETVIAEALVDSLSDEYSFCGSSRRLEDGSPAAFQLGDITVTKDDSQTCVPVDPTISCQVANAAIVVSGEVDGAAGQLRDSLGFMFENDAKFVEELPSSGIVEVRLKEGGEEAEANSVPREFGDSAQPTRSAVVAILSTAGISIAAAIIVRARRKERRADKFSESDSEGDTLPINNMAGKV